MPGRRHARDDGGRLGEGDRAHRGRRRGPVLLRQRRLPSRSRDRDLRQPRVDGRRDHDAQRPSDRLDARAHAFRRVQAGPDATAPSDVRDAPSWGRVPRGYDAGLHRRSQRGRGRRADASRPGARGRCVGRGDARDGGPGASGRDPPVAAVPPPDAAVRREAGWRQRPRGRPVAHRRGLRRRRLVRRRAAAAARPRPVDPPPACHAANVRGPSPAGDADALRRSAGAYADAPRRRRRARSRGRRGAARRRSQRAAGEERLGELALRVVLQGLRGCRRRRGSHPRRAPCERPGPGPPGRLDRRGGTQRPAVHPRRVRAARDGDVHRGRRLRHRRARREGPARSDGARHQRRAHAQLHRERARHPQLDLRLPRRRHPQPPGLRGRLSRRDRRQARAELPLDADDPERGERGHLQQPRAEAQVALDGPRRRRPHPHPRAGRRARRGAVRRRRDRAARWTPGSAAPRSRSSTGPTRCPGCSRTRSCAARSPTR